ncbi:MAG TPA: histidine kinase, partial [Chitinophagaceae bacterium]|nr:histidine kinase [Chitinophagaceae bacterium]
SLDSFLHFEDQVFLTEANSIRSIIEDNAGNLWFGTISGIIRVNRERNETTLFGKNYGISEREMFFGSAYIARNGKLYFLNVGGYYAFFPEQLIQGMRPPEIIIAGFRIANKLEIPRPGGPLTEPVSAVSAIRLKHHQNVFSFEFAGIDYSNPEDNRHLFMLENYDAGWNLAGAERKAIYFNVPPGKYVFRVKVVNSYGIWAEKSIAVIITPPWWNTWWFRIAAVLIIAGTFYAIIRWRVRQKFHRQLERSEKDKQLAELRQKTGELEMQALRAQMNPHFVFNSLNAINRFILQNNKTQASEYLTKFSRLVRMILQNSQSTLITLESELDSLRLYLELEALRFDNRFEYKISVSKDLDIDLLKVPPLIIQPYAENAIWHGLMHKEEKGHLEIDITQEGENLLFRIKDDGIGRQQSAALTSKSATRHKSMGLKITADRIAMLQRSVSQQSPVVINDLVNADGSPAGTEVLIKIPVTYD